ncbi:hypothetical protein CspeluHIS016_0601140 [Cutaneotrichosporon spelunceum]|uniref:Amino acid transporter n=1 Tax=Cutaneotrichosporon spelunceum TaxID=1672016 RepID=A0AAD3YE64_9TREE|nr:hypothetical protein CspeluHIS016_0601140 [Cutaneotrichosporon spelunceum]
MESDKKHTSAEVHEVKDYHDGEGPHHNPALERNFSFWSCLGLAFAILNSWNAMAASMSVALPSGGSIAMVWGLPVSAVGTLLMAVSLAEAAHAFPTTGGQYDWTYCVAPVRLRVGLSFVAGWTATTGWIALVAANSIMTSNFVMGIISLLHPTFASQPYQIFLLYLAMTLLAYLLNTFAVRLLPYIDTGAMVWSMLGIVTVMITLLACASPAYQPAKAVFATWTNSTGWPDGMAFMLALLQSVLGFTAFDAVSHLSEEMPRPSINAPKAMVIAVTIGAVTGWLFLVILLLCLKDLDAATGAATGPLIEIYRQVTGSNVGTTCLVMFNLVAMFFACQGACTVASRLLMTFGRDNGMAGLSRFIGAVHPRLLVPQWAVLFVAVVVVIFGLINLGSSVALNAIISSAIVFLQVSYFIPILCIFLRGEEAFGDAPRIWSLGRWRRPINGCALAFLIATTVCFFFPPSVPVTGSSMSYVVVVFAIGMLLALGVWIGSARKIFYGPSEMEARLVEGRRM